LYRDRHDAVLPRPRPQTPGFTTKDTKVTKKGTAKHASIEAIAADFVLFVAFVVISR
jgi:hypothetical protein